MKYPYVVALLAFLLGSLSPIEARPIAFGDAWQQLLKVSDKLQASAEEVNRSAAEKEAGDDLNLPSLSINGSYTRLEQPLELDMRALNPIAGLDTATLSPAISSLLGSMSGASYVTPFTEQDIFRASLQAMWPIYTGGRISAAQGIHAAQLAEKEQQYQLSTRDLFVQLVERYYAVTVSHSLAETKAQLVDSLTEHANHALKLEQQGQIAKVERLNAQVALENAKVDAASARRQLEMTKIALSRMLHEQNIDIESPLFILRDPPSLSQVNQLTLTDHPALKLLEAKEAQAQGLIDVEKGNYHPTVFLYGDYTLYEDDSLFAQIEPDWMVGVGVKIPLLSRDGRSGKVNAAKSALLQARHTKAQTQQDLSLLVDQSYRQLLQAQEEVQSLEFSLDLAEENKRLRDLAFTQGLSTSIEKVDAELKLNAVKTQQLAARYRYVLAYAKLMAVSGQLDEFIGRTRSEREE